MARFKRAHQEGQGGQGIQEPLNVSAALNQDVQPVVKAGRRAASVVSVQDGRTDEQEPSLNQTVGGVVSSIAIALGGISGSFWPKLPAAGGTLPHQETKRSG